MAIEKFADLGYATRTGSSDSSSGSETWDDLSACTLPAVSSSATPPTRCYLRDTAAPSELILVTSCTGSGATTATVTRGAGGTTPVTHAAGATFDQVTSVYGLGSFPQVFNVRSPEFGAVGDGSTDDTTAINDAITACIGAGGGIVWIPAGSYKVTSALTANVNNTTVMIRGAGRWVTTIASHVGSSADTVRLYDSSTFSSRTAHGSGIKDLTIDGTNAGDGATGLHMGDILQAEVDIEVQNFNASSASIGVHFDNAYYWTEHLHGRLFVLTCSNSVVFDCTSVGGTSPDYTSTGSFERADLTIWLDTGSNQYDGVTFQNGTYVVNGELRVYGNMASGPDTTTAACLTLSGATPADHPESVESNVGNSFIDVGVECDDTYTYKPQTVNIGGSNYIGSCIGLLNFGAAGNNFAAGTGSGNIGIIGVSSGDSTIVPNYFQQPVTASAGYGIGQYQSTTALSANGVTISTAGVGYVPCSSTAGRTGLILEAGTFDGQVVVVVNTNTTSGYTFTFAASGTSHVANGTGSVIAIETARTFVWANNTSLWYQST